MEIQRSKTVTDKRKFKHAEALVVAQELVALIGPHVERITIAGSLRRQKPEVSDVELLYVPKLGRDITEMFAPPNYNLTEEVIQRLVDKGVIQPRLTKAGYRAWGQQNKLATHVASGIPVDLFATTAEKWYVALVIRTGGKDTNLELTTGAQRIGRKLHAYGAGVEDLNTGEVFKANSEQEVFALCNVPYREPEQRE